MRGMAFPLGPTITVGVVSSGCSATGGANGALSTYSGSGFDGSDMGIRDVAVSGLEKGSALVLTAVDHLCSGHRISIPFVIGRCWKQFG